MNLQKTIRRILREDNKGEFILYRAVGLDEAIKSCKVGHLVYYSRDPMSRDWEVIEYGLGDNASKMSEKEVNDYVNELVPWTPKGKGVNLTSDLWNAKGYSDIVLEINLVGYNYAEFSDVHIFAKNPEDCKIKSVYYNGKRYSKEEFLNINKSLQESIRRILKEETHNTRGKIHLLRRVDGELIKKTFNMCLKKAEQVHLKYINKWKYFTLQKYKDFVIGMLIDELYFNNFEDTPPEIFSEIYDFFIDTYSEEISDSYFKISNLKNI